MISLIYHRIAFCHVLMVVFLTTGKILASLTSAVSCKKNRPRRSSGIAHLLLLACSF